MRERATWVGFQRACTSSRFLCVCPVPGRSHEWTAPCGSPSAPPSISPSEVGWAFWIAESRSCELLRRRCGQHRRGVLRRVPRPPGRSPVGRMWWPAAPVSWYSDPWQSGRPGRGGSCRQRTRAPARLFTSGAKGLGTFCFLAVASSSAAGAWNSTPSRHVTSPPKAQPVTRTLPGSRPHRTARRSATSANVSGGQLPAPNHASVLYRTGTNVPLAIGTNKPYGASCGRLL